MEARPEVASTYELVQMGLFSGNHQLQTTPAVAERNPAVNSQMIFCSMLFLPFINMLIIPWAYLNMVGLGIYYCKLEELIGPLHFF